MQLVCVYFQRWKHELFFPSASNVCALSTDAHGERALRHSSGREAFLPWWAVGQRQWQLHHSACQTWGETGQSDSNCHQNQCGETLPNALTDSVFRTIMASCPESSFESTGFHLACWQLTSPPPCHLMACWRSWHHGHLLDWTAIFPSLLMTEHRNKKSRAKAETILLLTPSAQTYCLKEHVLSNKPSNF